MECPSLRCLAFSFFLCISRLLKKVNYCKPLLFLEFYVLVYCQECGTNNDDTADQCSNCGAPLRSRRITPRRAGRDECFGLPQGGTIFGIIIGIVIILVGIQELMGWKIDLGPYMIILVGILIAAGAVYQMNKNKR